MPKDGLIARIEELLAKATPGPLKYEDQSIVDATNTTLCMSGIAQPHGYVPSDDVSHVNAELHVELRNAALDLIAVLRAAQEVDAAAAIIRVAKFGQILTRRTQFIGRLDATCLILQADCLRSLLWLDGFVIRLWSGLRFSPQLAERSKLPV